MKKVILKIEGMHCESCQRRLENYLNSKQGVKAKVDLEEKKAYIEYENSTIEELQEYVEDMGFQSVGIEQ